jgi:hypothetical protein
VGGMIMAFEKAKKKKPVVEKKKDVNYGEPHPTVEILQKEKGAQGQREMIMFVKGEHLNLHEALKAKCYDCNGYYADGIADCGDIYCPLHPYMPYNPVKSKLRVRKKND